MSKNPYKKKPGTAAVNNSMGGAAKLFIVGFLAEFYLLAIHRYLVRGSVDELVAAVSVLKYLMYAGLGLLAVGLVLFLLWRQSSRRAIGGWLLFVGAFLAAANKLMLTVYPAGTVALCYFVPVVMVVGVIYFLYQREFFCCLVSLGLSVAALIGCNKGLHNGNWRTYVIAFSVAVLVVLAAAVLVTMSASRSKGALTLGGKTYRLFPVSADYRLMYASYALSAAAILAALFAGVAFYAIWALGIAIFALAVYYTIKLM